MKLFAVVAFCAPCLCRAFAPTSRLQLFKKHSLITRSSSTKEIDELRAAAAKARADAERLSQVSSFIFKVAVRKFI
jgi:hypothetical protein